MTRYHCEHFKMKTAGLPSAAARVKKLSRWTFSATRWQTGSVAGRCCSFSLGCNEVCVCVCGTPADKKTGLTLCSTGLTSLLDNIQSMGCCWGWGCKNVCLTRGCPCSGEVFVSCGREQLTHWPRPSPSCRHLRARWGVPHKRRWRSAGTWDWRPLPAQDRPHQNLSCLGDENS